MPLLLEVLLRNILRHEHLDIVRRINILSALLHALLLGSGHCMNDIPHNPVSFLPILQ